MLGSVDVNRSNAVTIRFASSSSSSPLSLVRFLSTHGSLPTNCLALNLFTNSNKFRNFLIETFLGLHRISGLFYIRCPAGYPVSFAGYPVSFAGYPVSLAGYSVSYAGYPVRKTGVNLKQKTNKITIKHIPERLSVQEIWTHFI